LRVLALLYDVHGNLPALEAVLADAERAGTQRFLLGGDYALFGAWPKETVVRLRGLDAAWIRGNVDRWCADASDAPEPVHGAIARCRELLGPELVAELAALPEQTVLEDARFCHASPLNDLESFGTDLDEGEDSRLLDGALERRVVFGHTHVQFSRLGPDGIELVNPGSVGMPLDGDHRSAYALVAEDGGLDLRRVKYDWQASVDAVRERLGEAGEVGARRIEQARFEV
jgi:diadenosine tetraphosphatase ApaH/serine/threonine PP2A family protein phosphatase